jgi:hypothetical protein
VSVVPRPPTTAVWSRRLSSWGRSADRSTVRLNSSTGRRSFKLPVECPTGSVHRFNAFVIYRRRGILIGHNLPFDLFRIAVAHGPARSRNRSLRGGFTVAVSRGGRARNHHGYILDTATLGGALLGGRPSLAGLSEMLATPDRKSPSGIHRCGPGRPRWRMELADAQLAPQYASVQLERRWPD